MTWPYIALAILAYILIGIGFLRFLIWLMDFDLSDQHLALTGGGALLWPLWAAGIIGFVLFGAAVWVAENVGPYVVGACRGSWPILCWLGRWSLERPLTLIGSAVMIGAKPPHMNPPRDEEHA